MSIIIDKLCEQITIKGGNLFTGDPVLSINKESSKYIVCTKNHNVVSDKLVIAVPPKQFREIQGTVASKFKETPQFNSIKPISSFKGILNNPVT